MCTWRAPVCSWCAPGVLLCTAGLRLVRPEVAPMCSKEHLVHLFGRSPVHCEASRIGNLFAVTACSQCGIDLGVKLTRNPSPILQVKDGSLQPGWSQGQPLSPAPKLDTRKNPERNKQKTTGLRRVRTLIPCTRGSRPTN